MGGDSLTTITGVHPDILETHIMTRLDGPTLASAGCASSQLHALSAHEKLWLDICNQTWPSTAEPRLRHLISTFPAGHRSFYSDSFPALHHRIRSKTYRRSSPTSEQPKLMISAVDIHYQNSLVLSKVHESDPEEVASVTGLFRIDLLDPKETVSMPVKLDYTKDTCLSTLEENLTISWILIDPTRKRSANVSSSRPVSVDRNWVTGDIELRYLTVFAGERRGELVQCWVMVTCGGREAGDQFQVRLQVEDGEGKSLTGKASWEILQEAMEVGKRRRRGKRGEEKEWYEECLRMRRERRRREHKRQMRVEMAFITAAVAVFVAFWVFVAFKFLQLLQLC